MLEPRENDAENRANLKQISTHWTTLANPSRFITRYGAAVRAYLRAILPTNDDADEVEQEFLLQVVAKGFPTVSPERGHFRHYLMVVVRNAAYSYLRRRANHPAPAGDMAYVPVELPANREWQRTWRECVLQNTWRALRAHQKRNKGNLFYSVLKASVDHSEDDSTTLADHVSRTTGQVLSVEAFRKQLSRARQRFAELLINEVAQTITNVTPDSLEEELRDLDLLKYVRDQFAQNAAHDRTAKRTD